ncbi:MAG: hypothetical protein WA792_11025 [Pseudolabrys sp.]
MLTATTATIIALGSAGWSTTYAQTTQFNGQTYGNPQWGQPGVPAGGQYQNSIGQNGWTGGGVPNAQAPVPTPNQANTNFQNSRTGETLFTPADTRFKGRDRP